MGLGILLLLAFELCLRIFGVAEGKDYIPPRLVQVVKNGQIQGEFTHSNVPYFEQRGQLVETHPQYRKGQAMGFPASGSMRHLRFSPQPEENVKRYFLLGGSAALGQHPVDLKVESDWETEPLGKGVSALPESRSISGQVRHLLQQRGENVEVLNAGMIAQDSGGVRRIALEVLKYKPSGLLLYLGNNEGIGMSYGMQGEQLPMVPEVRNILRNFRIYRLVSDKIIPTRQRHSQPPPTLQGTKPQVLGQLTQTQWRAAGTALLEDGQPADSVFFALQRRFHNNISIIVEEANKMGVEVYIVPTAPNLNYPPFYDANSPELLESDIQRYTQQIGLAKKAEESQNWIEMEKVLNTALAIEENHASGWYLLGSALNNQQKFPQALEAREMALTLDISRKRTFPEYVDNVKDICSRGKCQVANAHEVIRLQVQDTGMVVYDQLWGDHEHLTPKGCSLIAEMFVSMIQ